MPDPIKFPNPFGDIVSPKQTRFKTVGDIDAENSYMSKPKPALAQYQNIPLSGLPTTNEKIPFNNEAYLDVSNVQTRPIKPLNRSTKQLVTPTQPTTQANNTAPISVQPQANSEVANPLNAAQPVKTTNVNYDLYQNNNPIVQGTNMGARDYFGFIKAADASSLINNLMQAPPPTIQTPLTHLERLRLDRAPIDNIKTQQQEQQATSFRNLREGVAQGSDLMRGIEAISKQGNEAARQTGAMYGEMNNQEMQANNQIVNQEQQIQDGQNMQEQTMNYDIQAKAQAEKNAAVTSNLSELKKDFMVEAQYNIQQQDQMRQQAYDKEYLDKSTKIKMLGIQHEASKDYNKTDEYQAGRMQHLNTNMAAYHKEAAAGTQFEGSEWGKMADAPKAQKHLADQILQHDTQLNTYQQSIQAEEAALAAMPDKSSPEYTKRQGELAAAQEQVAQMKTRRDAIASQKQHYDTYLSRLEGKYDQTGLSAAYDQDYRKKNAILGQKEYIESLQKMALEK